MELYLRYLARHERLPGEEARVGLILSTEKSDALAELLEVEASAIHVAEYITTAAGGPDVLEGGLRDAVRTAQAALASRTVEAAEDPDRSPGDD